MWPVLSDPSVKNIDITDDLLKAMWIGYIAAIAIAAVYVVETGKGMAERGNTLKEPPEKPGPDQDGG